MLPDADRSSGVYISVMAQLRPCVHTHIIEALDGVEFATKLSRKNRVVIVVDTGVEGDDGFGTKLVRVNAAASV